MAVLRYAQQEAANIRKAESRAIQQARLNASIAERKAEATASSIGSSKLSWGPVPLSSSDTGQPGQVAYDATTFYLCTATNTWGRVAIDFTPF